MKTFTFLLPAALLVLTTGSVEAQGFNINIEGSTQPAGPSAAYGGALGQAGTWNVLSAGTTFSNLMDLGGAATPVYMKSTGGADGHFDNPLTAGDAGTLLDNYLDSGAPGNQYAFAIRGLALGDYVVVTYAWSPDDPKNDVTVVTISGSIDPPQKVGGQDWGGAHALGVTYALHHVTVTNNDSFDLLIDAASGEGRFNGIQVIPDKCSTPIVYCTAKSGLACGTPSIGASGFPSASATSGFTIVAGPARSNRTGILLYSDGGRANLPFSGGTLCISPPIRRAGPTESGGTPGPNCDGKFTIDMNSFAQGLWVPPGGQVPNNPAPFLLVVGQQVNCQFWGRDTPATGTFLSEGLEYVICP